MKLRILRDSIRLRVTQGEVARLGAGESVVETTSLGQGAEFEYALSPGNSDAMTASMGDRRLTVTVPAGALSAWAAGDAVGVDCPTDVKGPSILVEKDFACLSPRDGDDDVDTYPHPKSGTSTC